MKKKQFIRELNNSTAKDLQVQLTGAEAAYFKLRFAHRVSPLENPSQLSVARRDIARIKTFIQIKKHAAQHGQPHQDNADNQKS